MNSLRLFSTKAFRLVNFCLVTWLMAGCSASIQAPDIAPLGLPTGGDNSKSVALPQAASAKVFRGAGPISIDQMNTVSVTDFSHPDFVSWFKIDSTTLERLSASGEQIATLGDSCSTSAIHSDKDLVIFDANGQITQERPIDDFNEAVFTNDPATSSLLRVTVHGGFSGCESVGVSFQIVPARAETITTHLTSGYYKTSSDLPSAEISLINAPPLLTAALISADGKTPGASFTFECYNSACVGRDPQRRIWLLRASDVLSLEIRSSNSQIIGDGELVYEHSATPRPINGLAPLSSVLDGNWLGTVNVGGTPVSAKLNANRSTNSSGTGYSLSFSFAEVPSALAPLSFEIQPSGEIVTTCVWNDHTLGTYQGGSTLQMSVLDNSCELSPSRIFKLQLTSGGQLQFDYTSGGATYSGLFTAW